MDITRFTGTDPNPPPWENPEEALKTCEVKRQLDYLGATICLAAGTAKNLATQRGS